MAIGKRGLKPLSKTVLKEIVSRKKKQKKAKKIKHQKKQSKPARKQAKKLIKFAKKPAIIKRQKFARPALSKFRHDEPELVVPAEETDEIEQAPAKREKQIDYFANSNSKNKMKKQKTGDRTPTGIPGLDEVMAGGYEPGSNNLVAGGAGSGKSIFAMQFLITGIEKGEAGIYVTFEEKKENVYKHMLNFGWDLEKYEKAGKFAFIEYTPEQVKKMLDEGGGLIDSLIKKLKAQRIVIDSISAFGLLFKDELSRRQATLAFIDLMRKWNVTALLTAEFEPDLERPSSSSIEFEVDSIVLLYYPREGDVRKRALEILKMRGTEHSKKIFPLKISTDGIRIYPKERMF